MKIKSLSILWCVCFVVVALPMWGQETTARQRLQGGTLAPTPPSSDHKTIAVSARAAQMNRSQSEDMDNAKWMREIYRYLDLSNDKNAPLYYPVQPEEGRVNLFTLIFKLLSEEKIKAYEYVDGRESFTDEFKIDFKEFLDRFGIYYENKNGKNVVEDVDIPGAEVTGYYVKEAYYFETGTSNYGIKTLAICPILVREGDAESEGGRYPLFWIPYDEIRPYAMRMPIMTSSLNNVMNGSVDDFFKKHNYDGEIYKTTNLQGKAIAQYATTPEEVKAEQAKIEKQLQDFQDRLWKQESLTPQPTNKKQKKSIFKRSSSASTGKTSSSSSSSGVSMRDRRM